ncbi:GD15408 [Drosophila simulans]|uniref:GD15408 n=1 Tax=Drosophila simulans TaxID=7240 RepID=B4NSH0_DROSI|nr:GD15408 [Drosophila simulans]
MEGTTQGPCDDDDDYEWKWPRTMGEDVDEGLVLGLAYKSAKVNETPYDLLLSKTFNLIQEDRIRETNGERFQNLHCSKCRMELGLLCLQSERNVQLKGLSLLEKVHLVVYDSYEVPFEMASLRD